MSLHYKVLNPLEDEDWDDLLTQYSDATFFHTQCWAKVLTKTYGYGPKYFLFFSENELCLLLPVMEIKSALTGRRGVSLPFTDFMMPLVTRHLDVQEYWDELIAYADKSKWQHIDLRGDIGFQSSACVYDSFLQHDVRLQVDTDEMFSRFSTNNKRNIKKAIREDVEIEIRHDMESIEAFYRLNSVTRKRHGVPSQPYRFFVNLYKYIIGEGKGTVVIAKKGEEVIAGAIYFLFGNKAIYKYGASKKEKSYLRANNLIMWEAIKWLSKRGCQSLCLGRTEKNNQGLLRYKMGWAPEQKTVNYYRYCIKDKAFILKNDAAESVSTNFFRRAPVSLSNFLGQVLYKHVG